MKKHAVLFLSAVVLTLWLSGRVDACSCGKQITVCQAYAEASAVFVGVVSEVSPFRSPNQAELQVGKLARLSVVEVFKDVALPEISVLTGSGGGDCGYPFEPGKRYLVYGYGAPPGNLYLGTNICTRTSPMEEANEDLDFLRGLPGSASKSRISGRVIQYTDERDSNSFKKSQPMEGLKIVITGNGRQFETVTDEQGVYHLVGLPPGNYKVTPVLPSELALQSWHNKDYVEATVPGGECGAADMTVETDGRIAGTVLNSEGKPAEGVQIDLIPVHLVGTAHASDVIESTWEKTDKDGHFQFARVSPGQYYLGVNLRYEPSVKIPFKRTYYPGTSDRDMAVVIELKKGQKLAGYNLVLPPAVVLRTVTGVFLWSDGKPVQQGHVYLTDSVADHGGHTYSLADVADSGRFSIQAIDGVQCWLHGWTAPSSDGRKAFVAAEPVMVQVNSDTRPARLIAPIPGDKQQ